MILWMSLVARRAEVPQAQFRAAWLDWAGRHARPPGVLRYAQNHVIDGMHRMRIPRGTYALDGISQAWFEDREALQRAVSSSAYRAGLEAMAVFARQSIGLVVRQAEFIPPPAAPLTPQGKPWVKRMSVLERTADLSRDAFHGVWSERHGPIVARLPELKGYIQDHVLEVRAELGDGHEPPACDGLTELWLEDLEAMERTFPPREPAAVTDHASRFIARITTSLVEEIRLD